MRALGADALLPEDLLAGPGAGADGLAFSSFTASVFELAIWARGLLIFEGAFAARGFVATLRDLP